MKTIFSDFSGFWNALEANQKVSFFLATVLVLFGVVGVSMWAQRPEMRLLYGGLDEKEAASIVQHLDGESIPYEIRYGGSAIFVPQKQVYEARMDVVSNGTIASDSVGFEIFDKNSFGASDFIQRTNFIRAIQGELARTIMQLRGVKSARVMVVMPESRLLVSQQKNETTASVFIDVGGGTLGPAGVRSIQALVANSVEGLQKSGVTVVDNNGTVLSKEQSEDSLVAASSAILEYRQSVESYFSGRVESMLERVLGAGNATVRVHAEIDSEQFSKLEEIYTDDSGTLLSSVSETEISSSTDPVVGGPVSAGDAGGVASSAGRTDDEKSVRDQEYAVDRTVTNTTRSAGTVRRLTASVFIASVPNAEGDGVTVRTPEEISQLRQIVANALGIDLTNTESGEVEVQEMSFAGSDSLRVEIEAAEEGGFDFFQLMQFGSEIAGSVVALILFIVFLFIYRKLKDQPSPFDQIEQATSRMQSGGSNGSQITPNLLNQLISQSPDSSAASIRSWLKDKDES